MSVENQERGLARPLELQGSSKEEVDRQSKTAYTREFLLSCAELDDCKQFYTGFDPSVFRLSKTAYTRKFLLSCAELDVCKQLPKGFDPTVLHELEDGFKGILEPWKGSGCLLLPNYGNIRCRAQFTGLDSSGSSLESIGRSDYLSLKWSRESNSQEYYQSDFKRHDDLTQCLVKVSGCKAEDMGKRIQETEKNYHYQLSKSENPYRPPHTYQAGRKKYETRSPSKETTAIEETDCGQEEMRLEGPRIAEDEQHEIEDTIFRAEDISTGPVYFVKPSCHDFNFLQPNVTSDNESIQFASEKANTSPFCKDLNEEQSRMILKKDVASSLNVPIGSSSTVIEKAVPQPLAANSECEMGLSGKTCFPITEDSCSMLKNSSEGNTVYFQINHSHEPVFEMEYDELLSNRGFYSCQRGFTADEVSEPYEFPFAIAYDLFSSVLCEHNTSRTNHQNVITAAAAADEIDFYDVEENECTFDDMWSEILEVLQFEQEMELASAAGSDQTADFKVQISLPDEGSLISIDNATSSEHPKFVPLNSSNNSAQYDAEIHLPDENSLITIDDLIAPENRLISIDHPTNAEFSELAPLNSSYDAVDYNTQIHLPDEHSLTTIDDLIAPENRFFSIDHATNAEFSEFAPLNSSGNAIDYNTEIHLPDENSLITIDDLIAPNRLEFIASGGPPATNDTWVSNVGDELTRQPGTPVITNPAIASATQGLEVSPFLDVTGSIAHQELHFRHSSLHNSCYPINSLEAPMRLQTAFEDPMHSRYFHALHRYSCPNMVHLFPGKSAFPNSKEFSYTLAQYSLPQQPSTSPQQCHLPIKDVASSNWEWEKWQLLPLTYQHTTCPDLAIENSEMFLDPLGVEGFDHQMGFNEFIEGRATKPKRALL